MYASLTHLCWGGRRSEADRNAVHVSMANEALCIGPAAARDSYLRGDRILEVVLASSPQTSRLVTVARP